MNENSEEFQDALSRVRRMALSGVCASEILRDLTLQKGITHKPELIRIFRSSLDVSLGKVTCIGGWWHDGSSEIDDNKINQLLGPVLNEYVHNFKPS